MESERGGSKGWTGSGLVDHADGLASDTNLKVLEGGGGSTRQGREKGFGPRRGGTGGGGWGVFFKINLLS